MIYFFLHVLDEAWLTIEINKLKLLNILNKEKSTLKDLQLLQ